jgi:hypothetical protein
MTTPHPEQPAEGSDEPEITEPSEDAPAEEDSVAENRSGGR